MGQGLSGGTTNLLRMARSGCQSGSSFVALALTNDSFATAVYPATAEPGAVDVSMVDTVVRQLWHDPGLGQGKALVRTVRIGDDRLAVAAVPLAMSELGQPSGILGVADPSGKTFGLPDLELLARIAQRLTSYVRARRTVRAHLSHAPTGGTSGSSGSSATGDTGAAGSPTSGWQAPATQSPGHAEGEGRSQDRVDVVGASGGRVGADRPVLSAPMWGSEADTTAARSGGADGSPAGGAPRLAGAPPTSLPLPPFPPPAGTAGIGSPGPVTTSMHSPVMAEGTVRAGRAQPFATAPGEGEDEPASVPSSSVPPSSVHDADAVARLAAAGLAGASSEHEAESMRSLLREEGDIEGLVPLGALLGRAGRLLGAGAAISGSLVVVAIDVEGMPAPSADDVARVARSMRGELRFDDPLSRIGDLSFVAVVPLAPGASTAAQVEAHLSRRVRSAVAQHPGARVHAAHVVAPLNGGQDADELLRAAVVKLRAR